jgi:demethoxyubiquinone hydroxylase (CLK1/Coq7/Cat5 family)
VIDKHYDKQISYFSKDNDELLSDLKKFQEDERCHKHEAQDFGASQAPFYSLSTSSIKMLCRAMIKIAHKL